MNYKKYENCSKTYVLVHNTGTGVMEDPCQEHDVVFETNDIKEAQIKAEELKLANNSAEDIASGWYNNSYQININTLAVEGKNLQDEFGKMFEERMKMLDMSQYTKHEINGITYYVQKLGLLDD